MPLWRFQGKNDYDLRREVDFMVSQNVTPSKMQLEGGR